jgi:hypothetical protein
MHAVVEINVGCARTIPLDKRARTGTNETVTRFVTDRVVSFGLNDNTSAAIPIQFAADKVARTSHWITLEKTYANYFAAHRVRLSRIEGVTVALRSTPATPPHTQLAYRRERLE